MTDNLLSQPWHEGYLAFEDLVKCPYPENSQEYGDWQWGYSCAHSEDEYYQVRQESMENEQ